MIDPGRRNLFSKIEDTSPAPHCSALEWMLFVFLLFVAMGVWFL